MNMTLIKHELRQGWKSLIIWTVSIGFFVSICVFMYPEMGNQMEDVNDMFSSMGSFTSAFGMDRLNFGTLIGFYAIECGNILGIGGSFFAALLGISALAKDRGISADPSCKQNTYYHGETRRYYAPDPYYEHCCFRIIHRICYYNRGRNPMERIVPDAFILLLRAD